jgi:uncharacterized protein YndB with AHSA1/START domain
MDPLTTSVLSFLTPAPPTAVWAVLTDPDSGIPYLHGLRPVSAWTPGAAVSVTHPDGPGLRGEVLDADAPHRLSFTLGSAGGGGDDDPTYVTWTLQRVDGGTLVRLLVDEIDGDDDESTVAWLPVLTAVRRAAPEP